jgi:hypothetical protein
VHTREIEYTPVRPQRIAVIAAPNGGYTNPGMLTVDLAAAAVLKRALPNCVLSWYTLHPPDEFESLHPYINPSDLPFDWLPLVEHFDDVCGHDAIVLWGDFLQARHYFVQDAVDRLVRSKKNTSAEQALDILYRCLLFSDAPASVLRKVIIFGSTILFNRQNDYALDRYGEHLSRLFRGCAGIWAREPVSAAKIHHIRQDYSSPCLGTDSAFLLRHEDTARLPTTRWIDDHPFADRVGVFFGVRTRPPRGLITFLQQVAQQLGVHLEWLPWFPLHEWLRTSVPRHIWLNPFLAAYIFNSRRKIDRLMIRGTTYSAGDLLAAIRRYRFVVTDTYHLCVNSWRVGTPAICFGSPEASPKHQTLDDYKKRMLYEMYEATDFYLSTSSVRDPVGRRLDVEKVVHTITDDSIARAITERIHAHARSVERSFADRLCGLVTSVTEHSRPVAP